MTPTPLEFACTLALILSGCSLANRPPSAAHDFPPVKDAPATAAVAAFRDRARTNGSITFRSWNGQALRMDSDTELTFYPDGSVHMFEWGFGLMAYSGSYRYPDGRVIVSFQEFEHGWPVMVIDRDEASLLLRPNSPRVRHGQPRGRNAARREGKLLAVPHADGRRRARSLENDQRMG